ncbi:MAG: FecCD family ABC transporter permease [Alphaproteobacteria bacterium]
MKTGVIISSFLVLVLLMILNMVIGTFDFTWKNVFTFNMQSMDMKILLNLRIPRALLALCVGTSLAISGAGLQAVFRNPLADPGLIGISSGSAVFAAIYILCFSTIDNHFLNMYGINIAAFAGGILTCFLVTYFAQISGKIIITYMLLIGVALNAIAGTILGLINYLSDDQTLRALTFWTLGSLNGVTWPELIATIIFTILGFVIIYRLRKALNLLMLGAEEADYVGLNSQKLYLLIFIASSLMVGASVAAAGMVGFVGLVIPHLVRICITSDHRSMLLLSAIWGSMLLLLADIASRVIAPPQVVPIGILTSLLGAPFFFLLLVYNIRKQSFNV